MQIHLGKHTCNVKEILYVPGLTKNLLSVSKMSDNNPRMGFDSVDGDNRCLTRDKSKDSWIVARALGIGKIFLLDLCGFKQSSTCYSC